MNDMKEQDLYISHKAAHDILAALEDTSSDAVKTVADELFKGDIDAANTLMDVFEAAWGESFLNEVCYWDTPAEDLMNMWRTAENLYDRFSQYADESGYVIRWMAYNEKYGLPIPEYDREDLVDGYKIST